MTSRSILKSKIQTLIEIKNDYDSALKNVEMLRNKKTEIEEEVNHMLQSLNMQGKTVIVNNKKILQKQVSITQSLTFKYIENVLEQYNKERVEGNKNIVNTKELLKFIKNKRPKYTKTELKID
tara:strand:+ start:108 stop:476 length:369 start_codon:yes stop_codon:yes gene_type:complete